MNNQILAEMKPSHRNLILLSIVMCPFITQIDTGMVTLSLPSIAAKFGISSSAATWISSIYIVFISATVLLFGKLGDTYGHFKVLKMGMVVFTISTLFAGLSTNFQTLLIARVVQAIGASASLGNSHGTITRMFPPEECGRVFGINACAVALGTVIGPSIGGIILENFSWNMLFLSEVPLCIFIVILQFLMLKNEEDGTGEKIDWRGSCYFFVTIASFFISLQQSQKLGISSPFVLGGFIVAGVFITAFIRWQKKTATPLLDLDLFKSKMLTFSLICTTLSYSTISAFNLIMPFYLQNVREMTPSESGLLLAIYPLLLVFIAPISGRLSEKIGCEILTIYGLGFSIIALVGMTFITQSSSYWIVILLIFILAIGSGLFQSSNILLVMRSVPSKRLGIGGSLNALSRNIGNNFGVVLMTIILYNSISAVVGYHTTSYIDNRPDAFMVGMRYTFVFASIIVVVAMVLALIRSKKKKQV